MVNQCFCLGSDTKRHNAAPVVAYQDASSLRSSKITFLELYDRRGNGVKHLVWTILLEVVAPAASWKVQGDEFTTAR